MDTSTINAAIVAAIKANGNNEITGPVLQSILLQIVSAVNAGKQDSLVSGESIKTVGGTSIMGAGDIPLRKTLALQQVVAMGDATLAEVSTALGIGLADVELLFMGYYDTLQVAQPDPSVCHLISSQNTPGDHTCASFGFAFGIVEFYKDYTTADTPYSVTIENF